MPFGQAKTYGFNNAPLPFLIISGSGSGIGVFVYNGTPQLGNPPITWLTNGSLVDPYGNVLPAVIGVEGVGTFSAGDTIITPNGTFVYSSTPGVDDLLISLANGSGFDEFNNPYQPGVWVYGAASNAGLEVQGGTATLLLPPVGLAHGSSSPPSVFSFGQNIGLVNELTVIDMFSGQETIGGNTAIQLFSESNDATLGARGSLVITGTEVLGWNASNVTITTGGGVKGNPVITQFDNTVDTNANNGTQPATMQWPIPINDAKVGTVYEIETPFNGTFETATLGFKPSLNGAAQVTSGGDTIGAAFFAAGIGFAGQVKLKMTVLTTGPTGTVNLFIEGGIGQNTSRASGANNNNAYLSSQATGVAFNTTVANTIAIDSVWGAAVAAQTVSSRGSVFTRKGP